MDPFIHTAGILSIIWALVALISVGILASNPFVNRIDLKPIFFVPFIGVIFYIVWLFQA